MVLTLSTIGKPHNVVRLWRTGRYILGSGINADFRVLPENDPYVSAQHALVEITSATCILRSLGGPNPVTVNDLPIRDRALSDGDVVQLGFTQIQVRVVLPKCQYCGSSDAAISNPSTSDDTADLADVEFYSHRSCLPAGDEFDGQVVAGGNAHLSGPVSGPLTIRRKLGSGGFGSVFLAYDPDTSRVWAVKNLSDAFDKSQEKRLAREGRFLTDYVHSHIARCVGTGVDPRWGPYLISEFIPDGDLAAFIKKEGPQDVRWTITTMIQILMALEFLHTLPSVILHRDIKPHNILLNFQRDYCHLPVAKLADFGIARALDGPGSTRITQTGGVPGTLLYLAPEVLLGKSAYGVQADVYSAGVTTYYILTGKYPYSWPKEGGELAFLFRLASQDPSPIQEHLQDIPVRLSNVLNQACAKNADERFSSAGAFAHALRSLLC